MGENLQTTSMLKTEMGVHINQAYLRKMSVLGNKGDQVEDEPVLCYFSPYSEDELTAHFEGLIPMPIQVQHISLNVGQTASCMETVGC